MINKSYDYKIVNIVASTNLNEKLDLNYLNLNLNNSEYEPEIYFALIYRLNNPKLSILVNKSGKIIITGAKSLKDIDIALNIFENELINIGYKPAKSKIKIQNIVVTANLGKTLNLEIVVSELENTQYEPEQFPGVFYRFKEPKIVVLIFGSGKLVCTGAKSLHDAQIGIEKTIKNLIELV